MASLDETEGELEPPGLFRPGFGIVDGRCPPGASPAASLDLGPLSSLDGLSSSSDDDSTPSGTMRVRRGARA